MKKRNFSSKLSLKKAQVADLNAQKTKGGRAQESLQDNCVSYPYRCSVVECELTDVTCYYTQTCQPVSGVTEVGVNC
ncbi:hypothetical protein IMCC3317_47580 [Kordia antarctica]|uniref:Uncharacterized protein n=1 Tax=Kordia antarctica TaxID=1218801 RepID=A0A7L4ZRM4_9FLAO|nr:class I lanthipeptide [Kordia antarctica]QHI39348.1 hypothetical protein IMCC3317_47580 [Kordia antarctica]